MSRPVYLPCFASKPQYLVIFGSPANTRVDLLSAILHWTQYCERAPYDPTRNSRSVASGVLRRSVAHCCALRGKFASRSVTMCLREPSEARQCAPRISGWQQTGLKKRFFLNILALHGNGPAGAATFCEFYPPLVLFPYEFIRKFA